MTANGMIPGQEPYTHDERARLAALVADAAAGDPGEAAEPAPCPCDRGYLGHADNDADGHRCEYHPGSVDRLSFRTSAHQLYRDSWRRVTRWCDFTGSCVVCGRRCYGFRDGDDDPRGPLGDHADSSLDPGECEDIRTVAPLPASGGNVAAVRISSHAAGDDALTA